MYLPLHLPNHRDLLQNPYNQAHSDNSERNLQFRAPAPQYGTIRDIASILKEQGDSKNISLKELTGKLARLMALVGANRMSELQALDLRFRSYSPNSTFKLASLIKILPQDSHLCVVQCLQVYEEVTKKYRDLQASTSAPPFLSYVKPHKPVKSQRIAH